MRKLSVLIPARNEMWLSKTVEDVLRHAEDDTDIIVVLDGAQPDPHLPNDSRITTISLDDPIGQRAATNLAATKSAAQYVMKLDAHCSVDRGFDRKLIASAEELGELVTQVPSQYNLHVFDWVCDACGHATYQGPTPKECEKCKHPKVHRNVLWQRRKSRLTEVWRFDKELHFQYWREREKYMKDLTKQDPDKYTKYWDTMSCLGACWFLSRKRYFDLGGMDEGHGSWGQMGTELSCKAWLSGGRLVTNRTTWFAHMFRTQGGDFSFPYPITHREQEKARQFSRNLWLNNAWPQQIRPLSWMIEHFEPVPDWNESPSPAAAVDATNAKA
jgi:glycosyltransferase involved in cell wall biosynthesis